MKRFPVLAVLLMGGLLTACEKGDTETTMEKAADVAGEAADATKKAAGEAMESTGDKMQEAGEAVSETGESMKTPE